MFTYFYNWQIITKNENVGQILLYKFGQAFPLAGI